MKPQCSHETVTELRRKLSHSSSKNRRHSSQFKPQLRVLQDLVNKYLTGVTIRYASIPGGGIEGRAILEQKIIKIDPSKPQSRDGPGCDVGYGYYNPAENKLSSLKLTPIEKYVITVLHEIGHFKFPIRKHPKWVREVFARAKRERRKREILAERTSKKLGIFYKKRPITFEEIMYQADSYLSSPEKVDLFRTYILGTRNHVRVANWSWREFLRLRKLKNKPW